MDLLLFTLIIFSMQSKFQYIMHLFAFDTRCTHKKTLIFTTASRKTHLLNMCQHEMVICKPNSRQYNDNWEYSIYLNPNYVQISKLHAGNTEYVPLIHSISLVSLHAYCVKCLFTRRKREYYQFVCRVRCVVIEVFFLFLLSFRFSCPLPSFQFDVLWDTERTHIHLMRDSMVKLCVLCGK